MMDRTLRRWLLIVPLAFLSLGAAGRGVPIVDAAKGGDTAAVRTLLRQGVDVNAPDADGTTALHWAVNRDDMAMMDQLIRAGAKVRAANRFGVQPLSLAAENGNAAIVERLLAAGADANTVLYGGETALMTAARTGRADAIRVLLAHGAKVNAREDTHSQTALMWAATEGNVEALQTLIEGGADIHARSTTLPPQGRSMRNRSGTGSGGGQYRGQYGKAAPAANTSAPHGAYTALLFAVRAGRLEPVRMLLDAGANINDSAIALPLGGPQNALMLAVANANYEIAAFLLDRGADPNDAGAGWTALHTLSLGRSQPYKTRGSVGWTAGPTIKGNLSGLELAKKLVAKGANVNARSTKEVFVQYRHGATGVNRVGATPFLLAAKAVDFEMMRVLASLGADPNIRTVDGVTPMMTAAGIGNKNGTDSGFPEEAMEAVKVCLELGSDINAADRRGWTALHSAVLRGYHPLVEYLVDKGARLDARTLPGSFPNDPGVTPRGLASGGRIAGIFYRRPALVALLGDLMRARGIPVDENEDQQGIERGAVQGEPQP